MSDVQASQQEPEISGEMKGMLKFGCRSTQAAF